MEQIRIDVLWRLRYTTINMIARSKTVTIQKAKLDRLKKQAQAYRDLAAFVFRFVQRDPLNDVVEDFRDTGLYSDDFLKDLRSGLERSSFTKQYATCHFKLNY